MTHRARFVLPIIAAACASVLGAPVSAQQVWQQGNDVTFQDPLEIGPLPEIMRYGNPIVEGTHALVLHDDPNDVNKLVDYRIPIAEPDQATASDVTLPSSTAFGLSHFVTPINDPNDPNFAAYAASIVVDNNLTFLYSTAPGNWTASAIPDPNALYFSSELGVGGDDIFVLGYDANKFVANVYKADRLTLTFSLDRTIDPDPFPVVDTVFGYPRVGMAVDPVSANLCFFGGKLTATNVATYFYECSGTTTQSFDTVSRANGFPESNSRWLNDHYLYAYYHAAQQQVRLVKTSGGPTFVKVTLGTAPAFAPPTVTATAISVTNTPGDPMNFFGIGMAPFGEDSVLVTWPGNSVLFNVDTDLVTPVPGYPFDRFGPNGVSGHLLIDPDDPSQTLAFALSKNSLGTARLVAGTFGVAAPAMNQLALIVVALLLLALGIAIRRKTAAV